MVGFHASIHDVPQHRIKQQITQRVTPLDPAGKQKRQNEQEDPKDHSACLILSIHPGPGHRSPFRLTNHFPVLQSTDSKPTVSNVDAAYQIPENAFLNISGCASCSKLYIHKLDAIINTNIINTDDTNCWRFPLITSVITCKES